MSSDRVGPQINGILNILVSQDATELRLGCDKPPGLFAGGVKKRFVMPQTSEEMLRGLLGELITDEVTASMSDSGAASFEHAIPSGERFSAQMKRQGEGTAFDIVFKLLQEAPAPTPEPEEDASQPQQAPPQPVQVGQVGQASPAVRAVAPVQVQPEPLRAKPPTIGPVLANLLSRAVTMRASDLHLADGELPHLRVDGKLRALIDAPASDLDELLEGCLVPWVRQSLIEGRSADLSLKVPSLGRFRVNIYRAQTGLAAAIRLLPERAPKLSSLNLTADISDLARLPNGLVILTGPTGSGKSSTLAALAQQALLARPVMLLSLEDPIEFSLRAEGRGGLVRQREIGRHARDFATGLRDALREDPDVILVGEMRDWETISLALTAAETGHLVLTSLHSRSAAGAVQRIIDASPADRHKQVRLQLAEALKAVIAQRLLPRLQGRGRLPVLEVLRVNHNVSSLIREGRTEQLATAIQSGGADGMVQLERALADLVLTRQIERSAARAMANDREAFDGFVGR